MGKDGLAEWVDHSHQVSVGLVAVTSTPPPVSVSSLSSALRRRSRSLPLEEALEEACLLKRRVLSPLARRGELFLLPIAEAPSAAPQASHPRTARLRKGKGILLLCLSLFVVSLNRSVEWMGGDVGGVLSWYVTKGASPEATVLPPWATLEETSTASAQICKLSSMFAHILSSLFSGCFLLLGRWLAGCGLQDPARRQVVTRPPWGYAELQLEERIP